MALKDILVHLDAQPASTNRLHAALALAKKHDASLTGLYVLPHFTLAPYVAAQVPEDLIARQQHDALAIAETNRAEFETAASAAGCRSEWHSIAGGDRNALNSYARHTDLVVIGQAEEGGFSSPTSDIDERIILGSARPVMIVPYIGSASSIGNRVLVAWNNGREAVRAVNDALPLLAKADTVEIMSVNPPAEADTDMAKLRDHLARHGINAVTHITVANDIGVGDALLGRVSDRACDLLVMGAYGHSRLRETILGGVTQYMLKHMTVPVIMSH